VLLLAEEQVNDYKGTATVLPAMGLNPDQQG